jgi:hypothetical protein
MASLNGKPKNDKIKDLVAAPVMASLAVQSKNDDVQDSVPCTKIPSPGGSRKPTNESDVGDESRAHLYSFESVPTTIYLQATNPNN